MLVCPKCKHELYKNDKMYQCENHHTFDIAKKGYVHLFLKNRKQTGDDKHMVKARTYFLEKGFYQPLCDQILLFLKSLSFTTLVDAGCGEGYYTNQIADLFSKVDMYAFDLSKHAIHEACKGKNQVFYGVCSIADLPLKGDSIDIILSIFAPIQASEFYRVLKKQGYFLKVAPGPKHLYEMKQILYTDVYDNDLQHTYEGFELQEIKEVAYDIELCSKQDIEALFMMTPYYWKSPIEGSKKLLALDYLKTKVQFQIELYRCIEKKKNK